MGFENTGDTRKVWFTLATEGGRWERRELLDKLPDLSARDISGLLAGMVRTGHIVRFDGRPIRWGVMPGCTIPAGLKIGDLVKTGVVLERA